MGNKIVRLLVVLTVLFGIGVLSFFAGQYFSSADEWTTTVWSKNTRVGGEITVSSHDGINSYVVDGSALGDPENLFEIRLVSVDDEESAMDCETNKFGTRGGADLKCIWNSTIDFTMIRLYERKNNEFVVNAEVTFKTPYVIRGEHIQGKLGFAPKKLNWSQPTSNYQSLSDSYKYVGYVYGPANQEFQLIAILHSVGPVTMFFDCDNTTFDNGGKALITCSLESNIKVDYLMLKLDDGVAIPYSHIEVVEVK